MLDRPTDRGVSDDTPPKNLMTAPTLPVGAVALGAVALGVDGFAHGPDGVPVQRRFAPAAVEINPAWAKWIDQRRDADPAARLEARVVELEGLVAALAGRTEKP